MSSGEEDFTKRSKAFIDHMFIKGVALQDPTVAACLPSSIENAAIAYNATTNRFRVDIEALTVGILDMNLTQVLSAALAHDNPVIVRLTDGSAFIDPKDIRALTSSDIVKVYGSQTQALLQRATTYDSLVQLRHEGAEIDPRAIRALTSTDIITAYGNLDALQQRATSKDLFVQIRHGGAEKDPTQIRALTNSDVITVEQATAASLKATVTQAEKDRTITDVSYVGTLTQISETWAEAGNKTIWDPAADKKVRIKLLSLELSADVDLGFRFGAAGTIYYLRTSAGPIVTNFIGANFEGAADELFILYASGACTVKGYVIGEEL